jgi:hypothetical protein
MGIEMCTEKWAGLLIIRLKTHVMLMERTADILSIPNFLHKGLIVCVCVCVCVCARVHAHTNARVCNYPGRTAPTCVCLTGS